MNKYLAIGALAVSALLVEENIASRRAMKIGLRRYYGDVEKAEMFAMCDCQTLPEYYLTLPGRMLAKIAYIFE